METLQTLLNYAAITPFIIAAGMFIDYCWQRSTPRTAQAVVEPEQNTQELNSDPEIQPYHPVEVFESFQSLPDPVMTWQPSPAEEPITAKIEPTVEPAPKKKRGRPRKNQVAIAV